MSAPTRFFACATFLMLFGGLGGGQTASNYLLSAQRSGAIHFRDPVTLEVISRLDVALAGNSTGVNGVWSDPNGQRLYIEGPEHIDSHGSSGCCWLYSIDLPNGQAKVVAGIWGSKSRQRFVNAGSSLLTSISDGAWAATQGNDDRWLISPDGRWWAGLRSGPAVDLYDATRNKIVRSFTAATGNPAWYLKGAWIKDQFYLYTVHDGSGWLWHLSPESDRLAEPVAVPTTLSLSGCESNKALTEMYPIGDRLVFHEVFGAKVDRRQHCDGVPGGAWIIDPTFRQSVIHLVPQFYFWQFLPSQDGASFYGVTSDSLVSGSPAQLVHVDARSGKVLKTQSLEGDYWWIATANLRSLPDRSKFLLLPIEGLH